MTIKAIETIYKGYKFRSRLEARWAVLLDALNIEWEYEKEGYELDNETWYLPDFWLPKTKKFIEIKPASKENYDLYKNDTVFSSNLYLLSHEQLGNLDTKGYKISGSYNENITIEELERIEESAKFFTWINSDSDILEIFTRIGVAYNYLVNSGKPKICIGTTKNFYNNNLDFINNIHQFEENDIQIILSSTPQEAINQFIHWYSDDDRKCATLSKSFPIMLFYGLPLNKYYYSILYNQGKRVVYGNEWCIQDGYYALIKSGNKIIESQHFYFPGILELENAVIKAKQARFEHGESG